MAFNTAITGLKASTIELDVTGNNIANSSTVGFKSGRTEFADIFTTVVVGAGSTNNPGAGVIVSDIAQDFTAGTIEFTNNNLDLAIDGTGFFQLNDGQGGITYTRAGGFELDKDGNVVSKSGKFLQGYGLDEAGNQQPIGTLAVSEKESPPRATRDLDLSFNIDSRADPTDLREDYSPDDASSFTFSTTSRTFDSLGNEHTIKFDFVEQGPWRERQNVQIDNQANATTNVTFANVPIRIGTAGVTADTAGADAGVVAQQVKNAYDADPDAFPDTISSLELNGTSDGLVITYKASAANVDDIAVSPADATVTATSDPRYTASEMQTVDVSGVTGLAAATPITIGGVNVTIPIGDSTQSEVVGLILAQRSAILAKNPAIQTIDRNGNDGLLITYKPEAGDVDPLVIDDGSTPVFNNLTAAVTAPGNEGDNSYQGVYQMYAYLNGTELLDVGAEPPPGAPTPADGLNRGPILLQFDTTNGTLESINGKEVPPSGIANLIEIKGADPAAADPTLDENIVELDLTGSTQFASESIVKASTQDGYTKGDLIGVAFAENGTMVASFSNGQNSSLGIVALASFENQGGLQPTGSTEWKATLDSGQAILNPPGAGLNGSLRSAALEQSNVDLSEELVALIEAQRNFQANSKTLQTENSVTQTILQIQ